MIGVFHDIHLYLVVFTAVLGLVVIVLMMREKYGCRWVSVLELAFFAFCIMSISVVGTLFFWEIGRLL